MWYLTSAMLRQRVRRWHPSVLHPEAPRGPSWLAAAQANPRGAWTLPKAALCSETPSLLLGIKMSLLNERTIWKFCLQPLPGPKCKSAPQRRSMGCCWGSDMEINLAPSLDHQTFQRARPRDGDLSAPSHPSVQQQVPGPPLSMGGDDAHTYKPTSTATLPCTHMHMALLMHPHSSWAGAHALPPAPLCTLASWSCHSCRTFPARPGTARVQPTAPSCTPHPEVALSAPQAQPALASPPSRGCRSSPACYGALGGLGSAARGDKYPACTAFNALSCRTAPSPLMAP